MANLLIDFTKGFASSIAPESLSDLKSDAEEIYSTVIGGAKTAHEKYREISRSPMVRKISGFFTKRSDEFAEGSSLEDEDDEFDAGFKFGGDDEESDSPKVLDAESMKSITRGQVSSMYQIAGKQVEAATMNTSEIITTINTRTSEVLSSLSNINSSLQTIGKQLDKIIELSTLEKRSERDRSRSLYDSYGNLTLNNTFQYLLENNPYQEYIEGYKMLRDTVPMLFSASESKAEAFGNLAGISAGLFGDKRLGILGDRSINDIRNAVDERVANAQNNLLSKLLDWDKFKGLFGDLTRRESGKDYSFAVENQYTRDRAVFDNMTRKTIVDIIPGYLRRITSALTGENLYISSEGSLTTERESPFKEVFNSTLTNGFNNKRMKDIMDRVSDDVEQSDVYMAQRVLVSLYVFRELQTSGERTKTDLFENGGDPETNKRAIDLLSQKGGKPRSYWTKVIEAITAQLIADKPSRTKFAQIIRQTADASDKRAVRYAREATITYDIKAIDDEMVTDVVGGYIERASGKDDRTWNERVRAGEIKRSDIPQGVDPNSRASDDALKRAQRERIRQSEAIGNIGKSFSEITLSTVDYLGSIFSILNRGINVFAVSEGPFPKMKPRKRGETTGETGTRTKIVNVQARVKPKKEAYTSPELDIEDDTSSQLSDIDEQPTITFPQQETQPTTPTADQPAATESLASKIVNSDIFKSVKQKITDTITPFKDKVSEKASSFDMGDFVEGVKSGTRNVFQQFVRDPFERMKTNVMTDMKTIKAQLKDEKASYPVASGTSTMDSVEAEMAKQRMSELGESDDDKNDKAIADAVLAAMNAATADGDTQEDIGPLMSQISDIKDQKLKSRLTKVVEGTLQRSENKKPAQSKIGKILMWGLGLVKGFVLPTLSKAKTFITTLGKKLLSPILKSLKQSGQRIVRGASAVKEGLFGSEDSQGLLGIAKDKIKSGVDKVKEKATEVGGKVKEKVNKAKDSIQAKLDERRMKKLEQQLTEINEKPKAEKKEGTVAKTAEKIKDKMKQSEFGQGFLSAFEKKKDVNNMKPQTLADQMSKSIHDILKSKDGGGSVFATIISKITNISDVFKEGFDEIKKKKESGETQTSTTDNTSPTSTSSSSSEMPSIGGSSSQQSSTPQMDSISTGGSSTMDTIMPTGATPIAATPTASGGSMMESISTAGAGATASGAASAAGGAAAKKGIGFSLGKILGGITGILGGLLQAVLTVVMSMAGFKKIMNLVMSVLKNSLKPLNKAFNSLYKAIKPVMKTIQKVLKKIMTYVVEIVESVIKIIQPILELIGPIIEQLMDVLKPMLDMITGLVNILMVPLVATIQTVVVPVVQTIGNTLEIILGIVQVGIGLVLTALGGLLISVGAIGKILGAGSLFDTGKNVAELGTNMISSGSEHVVGGFKKQLALASSFLTGDSKEEEEETTTVTSSRQRTVDTLNGSPMDGIYGSGDINSIYGGAGANQNRFGNYMNMGQRGCGPVALADAFARRSGTSINARGLTSAMASSGTYDPSMGTSVGGFISASNSMGMNVRAGGVTPASLKQATPHNPITIIGSGSDFTTRRGNNHYMNVVGSSGGTAFVSNPMNGRIERRSITSLAANSVMGLYGSGDAVPPMDNIAAVYGSGDAGFQFSDGVQEALTNLKEIVQNIINLFTGDDSVETALDKAKQEEKYKKSMVDLGNMTDEKKQELESEAFELYKNENPRFEGETDADYQKRFKKNDYYKRYMTMAAERRVEEEVKKSAGSEEGTAGYLIDRTLGEIDPETGKRTGGFTSDFVSSMQSYDESVEQGSFFNKLQEMIGDDGYWDEEGGESGFYSDKGARLYTDEYEPTAFDNEDAVNWRNSKGYWVDIPMHEWFLNNMPDLDGMSSAWKRYGPPANDQVEGLAGADHYGTDFCGPAGQPVRATTDGVVVAAGTDGGAGNFINIEDVGGDIHQYFHLQEVPTLQPGDEVYGGDEIGLLGSSGNSTGPHLHYQIKDPDTNTTYNPFTFFKWHEYTDSSAPYGYIDYEGQLEQGNAWPSHVNDTGVSKFMKAAFEAGLTGPEVAAITSMGIWEDSGAKLWGDKSLLNITHDKNGQQAVGIMNWKDSSVDYGDTIGEQLQYVQKTYFDEDSADDRALVRHNDYDKADLEAYKQATGRSRWELDFGDRYGPFMNSEDLIEGSEHWYRGALVPECIHTVEGPRKYIGTAVGVYNWLLDEGYISEDDGRSRVWRSTSDDDWYYEDYDDDSSYTDIGATAAGNTIASSKATTGDKKNGTPSKWTATKTGSKGWAYNAADQKLFEYWVISGQDIIDRNAGFTNKRKIVANMNGSFKEIWVNINSFPKTMAGDNARKFVNDAASYVEKGGTSSTVVSSSSSSDTAITGLQQISTPKITDADIVSVVNDIYKSGVYGSSGRRTYISDWDSLNLNNKISKLNTTYDSSGTKYTLTKQMLSEAMAQAAIEKNNRDTAAARVQSQHQQTIDYMKSLQSSIDNWKKSKNFWSTYGNGDVDEISSMFVQPVQQDPVVFDTMGYGDMGTSTVASQIMPSNINDYMTKGITDLFTNVDGLSAAQTTAAPVVVNRYDIPQQDYGAIEAILTNTYNIRSVQIEATLENMLKLMRERNQQRAQKRSAAGRTGKSSNKQDTLFSEQGIPKQIERLSVG